MHILILFCLLLTTNYTQADVRFITETENTADYEKFQRLNPKYTEPIDDYAIDNASRCKAEGYTYSKCASGMLLADPCPYDYSLYANCCPDTYRYTATECRAMGKSLGEYSCGGYYKCE